MPISAKLARKISILDPQTQEVILDLIEELDRQQEERITRKEFLEFAQKTQENFDRVWQAINELAEAQKRNEVEIRKLWQAVQELTEAQKRNEVEIRKLWQAVQELTEAQKRTEIRLNELAEAQKRTEIRLNELAEAQKRTEIRLSELAEAQKRTEKELEKLAKAVRENRRQIGGLSRSMAYALENEAFRNLPAFLRKRYGIQVLEQMVREEIEGEEVNLLARAKRDGEEVMVVGEAVLRLDDRSKLRQLSQKVKLVERVFGLKAVPILVCHFAKKDLREKAKEAGILVVQSFEWV